jgi:cytochrome c556
MMTIGRQGAICGLLIVLTASSAALALTGAETVRIRQERFSEMARAMKFAANHWDDSGRYGDISKAAGLIERDAQTLPKLFPAGTGRGEGVRTDALSAIWSDRSGFDHLAAQLAQDAAKLASITSATPSKEVRSDIKVMVATCKTCHRDYRAD